MKFSPYQRAELWGRLEVAASNVVRAAKKQNSSDFHDSLDKLCRLEKELLDSDRPDNKEIKEMLTDATANFFQVEINNEADGGISPSTLDSAIESLEQAPVDVIIDWCGDYDTVNNATTVTEFERHIADMRDKLGGDTLLEDLLDEK